MKKRKSRSESDPYSEFLAIVRSNKNNARPKEVEKYLTQLEWISGLTNLVPCMVYLFNYQTRKYLYMNEGSISVCGYSHEDWMKYGQEWFVREMVHPDDLEVFSRGPFQRFINYISEVPTENMDEYRFSLSYRLKRKDGVYIRVLQQYMVLERDEKNNPIINLGIVTDITHFKNDDKIVFTISRRDKKNGFHTVSSDFFSSTNIELSPRETEVLRLIVKGQSNKLIAVELGISANTVRNHRQNLIAKTGSANTAELCGYAVNNGLV